MKLKSSALILVAISMSVGVSAPAFAGPKTLVELFQTRSSNAGAGNGAEKGDLTSSTTTIEPVVTNTYTTTTTIEGETVYLPSTTTQVETGRTLIRSEPAGRSGNIKNTYEVTYLVTTTTGSTTEVTTQTIQVTETTPITTITDVYADADPGNSGAHNRAPEASEIIETKVEEGDPVITEEVVATSTEVVQNEPDVDTDFVTDTVTITCNPSNGC